MNDFKVFLNELNELTLDIIGVSKFFCNLRFTGGRKAVMAQTRKFTARNENHP